MTDRKRIPATPIAISIVLWIAAGAFAATPAQRCQQGKNKEAGKYAYCRQKAEARLAVTGDAAVYTQALQKCSDKYTAKWPTLEQRAVNAGEVCPSVGDQAAIQGVIDDHTDNVATALAGGPLADCPTDLATCQSELETCETTPQGQRLKTGQTTCWNGAGTVIACAGTGHDGDLQKGLTRAYVDNGDGTITDTLTGLMWEKLADDGSIHDTDTTYTWTDAVAVKIAALNGGGGFAGYSDWRLPNVNELQSLTHYGALDPAVSAPFNTGCAAACTVLTCSCTGSHAYWSSSTYQDTPTTAWYVYFFDGFVLPTSKTNAARVRAVRAGS
jgi:hypothetical protein